MIIGVPGETEENEDRVALIPPIADDLVEEGHDIVVASGAGEGADWKDADYEDVGCEVVDDRSEVFETAEAVLHVNGLGASDDPDTDAYTDGQIVVGMLGPFSIEDDEMQALADKNVSAFALELMPRISRAQSMDALSSMASIGGYKATMMAADELPKMFPMEMTAAGTVQPADVFVIGAGVAGLKAIATSERLGASTRGHDVRLEVKKEVESLGAEFVELELPTEGSGDDEGYAVEMGEEFYEEQRRQMERVVPESDVLITTAAIPGRPAPEIVTTEMIEEMDDGSVVVDLAAATGGNCEPTVADETVVHDGVKIFGPTNLPSRVSHTASQLYSNNMKSFLDLLLPDGELNIDLEDEIFDSTLLTHDGEVRNPHIRDDGGGDGDDDDEEAESDEDDEGEGEDDE